MRKRFSRRLVLAVVAVAAVAILVPAIALTQGGGKRADLIIASASEPPDFLARNDTFVLTFTTANQGRKRARDTTTRAYLSEGRSPTADDRALSSSATVGPIARRGQRTVRVTLTIPADQEPGRYYLIVCADDAERVREQSESNNCYLSGQSVRIGATAADRGASGPPGPPGPPGPKGDPGPTAVETFTFPRTVMPMGQANIDDPRPDANEPGADSANGVPDEGSTENQEVLTVGPFSFRTLCRREVPEDDDAVQDGSQGRQDEAKILVYTSEGTFAFEGRQGARANIPAGTGTAGSEGATGGEGKHQIIAMTRDPDEGLGDGQNDDFVAGANGASAYLVHSSGWELIFEGYAGIDVLGAGEPGTGNEDRCVFGGGVTVVAKPGAR